MLLDLAGGSNKTHHSARHRRVKALWPNETTHEEFREAAERIRLQLGQANRFKEGLVRSGSWLPYIKKEFQALGIPSDLASLPHVESSFRSNAQSHAGAAGLWQFTRPTGRRYMRIDHIVDERLDPFIATKAAGLLLKNNHEITGTWPLALTAYNHGAAGMRRAIEDTGETDISVIVREYKGRTFGFASRNFYNAFVAANEIDKNPSKYFGGVTREPPQVINEVELPSFYTANSLMAAFNVHNNLFKSLNPALLPTVWSNSKYVPKGYRVRLPAETSSVSPTALIANIPADEKAVKQKPDVSYRVKKGDSLSAIAKRFKVKTSQLVAINGLKSQHKIRIGEVVKLPNSAKKQVKGAHYVAQDAMTYTVSKGDRLSVMALKAGVSESDIVSLNGLKNKNHLYVGQKLTLRAKPNVLPMGTVEQQEVLKKTGTATEGAKQKLTADPSNYLVDSRGFVEIQSDETLGHFADWLAIDAHTLRQLNKMSNHSRIGVGRRLQLDFSKVPKSVFEKRRLAYHQQIQDEFFKRFRVIKSEKRTLLKGESVWLLAQNKRVPMWLLRQYNTTVNLNRSQAGTRLTFPVVEKEVVVVC